MEKYTKGGAAMTWVEQEGFTNVYYCTECGLTIDFDIYLFATGEAEPEYCPKCGHHNNKKEEKKNDARNKTAT